MTAVSDNLKPYVLCRGDLLPLQSDSLWYIERGVVRSLTWTEAGELRALGYWGAGDVVGQPLSGMVAYQIECLTSAEVSLVPPHLWPQVLDAILLHVQQLEQLLGILHQERIPLRLLQLLVWLAQKFGRQVEQGQLIDIRLTHQEIAEVLSTTRVTVTRLLKQFEQKGFIRRYPHHIILCGAQHQLYRPQ